MIFDMFSKIQPMEFIVIVERNFKEDETFVHYCQWQGNEQELEKLFAILDAKDDTELYGDVSKFSYSRHRLTESAVDEHCGLGLGIFDKMFHKYVGIFKCPTFKKCEHCMEGDTYPPRFNQTKLAQWYARALDAYLYRGQLERYFRTEWPLLQSESEDDDE